MAVDAGRRIAIELPAAETVLAIQGPPGTGKTYTGARMIVDLRAGPPRRRLGPGPQGHHATCSSDRRGRARGRRATPAPSGSTMATLPTPPIAFTGRRTTRSPDALAEGTSTSSPGRAGCSPVRSSSRPSTCCSSTRPASSRSPTSSPSATAARPIVLLGDPNQLPQVSQGIHPDGAGASALEHVLGADRTLPADRGLFLPVTYRMHPRVNAFVSELFYDGRLETDPKNADSRSVGRGPASATGR